MSNKGENLYYKKNNIIGIDPSELDTPIYRVFPKVWLVQTLKASQNTLVKPRMWDDPFENFILKSSATSMDGSTTVHFDTIREHFYGQCWTFNAHETDALWRIYSHGKDGFRVRTTIRKLFDQFYNADQRYAMVAFFVGRIHYRTEAEIKAYFEDPDNLEGALMDSTGRGTVGTLLIKRPEFQHENELRLVANMHRDYYDASQDIYSFPININDTFEEILADPRMDAAAFASAMAEFRALGYANPIQKSTLYQVPNLNLRLNL